MKMKIRQIKANEIEKIKPKLCVNPIISCTNYCENY